MRILLIGRTGQLGGDLIRNNSTHDLIAPERNDLDVSKPDQVKGALDSHRPEIVINCAAFHNVPLCEQKPELAFRTNCVAMRDLAGACRDAGARLITFSSDYVFGGDRRVPYEEDALPGPLQIYGISRLAGEYAVKAAYPKGAVIVRTCGLYGASGARSKGGNFVDGRVHDARSGKTIEMAMEQIVAPTSTDDLSKAVLQMVDRANLEPGIYHLVNEGQCSWYEFTLAIVQILGLQTQVIPVDRGGISGTMRRPLFSVLANRRAKSMGIVLPQWRDALERYLQGKYLQSTAPVTSG